MYLNLGSGPTSPPGADTPWKQNARRPDLVENGSPQRLTLQHLIDTLIGDVIAPLIARTGDLDDAVVQLKKAVIRHLQGAGIPPAIAARHLGRCERSIYRHLEASRRPDDPHRPMRQLLAFVEHRVVTAGDCVRHMQKQYPDLTSSTVHAMLDAQVALGLLRRVTEERGRARSVRYEPAQSDRGASRVLLQEQVDADVMADIRALVLTRLNDTGLEDPGWHAENLTLMLTRQGLLAWLEPMTKGDRHEP